MGKADALGIIDAVENADASGIIDAVENADALGIIDAVGKTDVVGKTDGPMVAGGKLEDCQVWPNSLRWRKFPGFTVRPG